MKDFQIDESLQISLKPLSMLTEVPDHRVSSWSLLFTSIFCILLL